MRAILTGVDEELLSVRRLGQTNLTGTRRNRGNGEEPAVGVLNYSHLRVPLPQELANGEYQLFPNTVKGSPPEAYFLMVSPIAELRLPRRRGALD